MEKAQEFNSAPFTNPMIEALLLARLHRFYIAPRAQRSAMGSALLGLSLSFFRFFSLPPGARAGIPFLSRHSRFLRWRLRQKVFFTRSALERDDLKRLFTVPHDAEHLTPCKMDAA